MANFFGNVLNKFKSKTRANTQSKWNSNCFSNPDNFNKKDFRFVVTTLPMGQMMIADYLERYIETINDKEKLSCSIIALNSKKKQDCLKTWEKCGLILELDPDYVVTAKSGDMFSFGMSEQKIDELKKSPIISPDVLIKNTPPFRHNDVLVLGDKKSKLAVKGIYWSDITTPVPEQITALAEKMKLPIVDTSDIVLSRKDQKIQFEQTEDGRDISVYNISKNNINRCIFSKHGNIYQRTDSKNLLINMTDSEKNNFLNEVLNMPKEFIKSHSEIIEKLKEEKAIIEININEKKIKKEDFRECIKFQVNNDIKINYSSNVKDKNIECR